MRLARGSEQEYWLGAMQSAEGCPYPSYYICGRAKSYLGRYITSFQNLIERLKDAGWKVETTLGPRSDFWSSRTFAFPPKEVS